jgi:hypothetical protein
MAHMPDGSVKLTTFYQYQTTPTGFRMKSRGLLPQAILDTPDVKRGREEHYWLEFSKAMRLARWELEAAAAKNVGSN